MVGERMARMMSALQSMTLATRAALLVGALFALGFGLVTVHALRVFEARYLELVGRNQLAMLQAHASRLDDKFAIAQTVLAGVARTRDATSLADVQALQRFMDSRVFLHLSFDRGIRVYDGEGKLVVQSPAGALPLPAEVERELVAASLASGARRMSAPFAASPPNAQPAFAISAPVTDDKGRIVGAMVGSLNLLSRHYAADLQAYRVGQRGYLFITTRDRLMLMHPDPARLLKVAAPAGKNRGYDLAVEQGFEGTTETVNSTGLYSLTSFTRMRSTDWVLGANFPMSEAREPFRRALDALLGVVVAVGLALTLGVALMVRRLMQPIRVLSRHLADVGEGRARPLVQPGGGEARVLAQAYNDMLGRLEASEAARNEGEQHVRQLNETLEQRVLDRTVALEKANAELSEMLAHNSRMQADLVRSEKLAALGRLMAGLAHELNTPLGNALMVSSGLRDATVRFSRKAVSGSLRKSDVDAFSAYCDEAGDLVERNLRRASELMRGFKQAAADQTAERRRGFDLRQTVEEVVSTLEPLLKHRPVRLHLDLQPGLGMDSYPGAVGQVVTNLFTNALDHAFGPTDEGDLWISCQAEGEASVRLEVRDNGRGIEPAQLGKVFDPFFTTRLGQGGTGLGLYIAHNAVTGPLGGRIEVHSEPGQGTRFTVTLPRTAPVTAVVSPP